MPGFGEDAFHRIEEIRDEANTLVAAFGAPAKIAQHAIVERLHDDLLHHRVRDDALGPCVLLDIAFQRGRLEVEAPGKVRRLGSATETRREIVDRREQLIDQGFGKRFAVVDQHELTAQFGFVAADQCRHENLKIAVDLGQRRKPLLPVDHKALGTVAHVDRQTGNSAIHIQRDAAGDRWVKVLALYPRNELLKDQFAEVYSQARRLDVTLSDRSEEHTSELQSLMRISYAVFCLKKKRHREYHATTSTTHVIYYTQEQ